jgi:hypothetical protein
MKKIGFLISNKEPQKKVGLSDKDFFYLFERIIRQEYGNQGAKTLKPVYVKNGKIFVKSDSSLFSSELLLNKKTIIQKINKEIGSEEVTDLKIN